LQGQGVIVFVEDNVGKATVVGKAKKRVQAWAVKVAINHNHALFALRNRHSKVRQYHAFALFRLRASDKQRVQWLVKARKLDIRTQCAVGLRRGGTWVSQSGEGVGDGGHIRLSRLAGRFVRFVSFAVGGRDIALVL
jgi:hypothetical protein